MDLSYVLYDTAPFSNAAGTEHTLFQTAQGADAAHVEAYTNMRGAGALPNEEAFELRWLGVVIDANNIAADIQNIPLGSFLELRVADKTLFKCPLALLMASSGFGGHYTQTAAGDEALIGPIGNGYVFDLPVKIPGGTAFRVRVYQGAALAAGTHNVKVCLAGRLTMP